VYFFIDGLGGTGKTFLYRTVMANLRSRGQIVLATASSGIAATLLPGGRTTHSRFKLTI
jgi:CO dehydrogenase nickel-insertion accessory protein CooC1